MEKTPSSAPEQSTSSMENTEACPQSVMENSAFGPLYMENGIYLSRLHHAGQEYRLGATTPRFLSELTSLPVAPSPEEFEDLQRQGLWLMPATKASKVAVTCGGVGSVWPGMGRALYDTFPAAREAMDRLAAVAPWDVLALMDETDMEKIQCTRWQMPYLFFVEYAQACYLQSLGFAPCLMSGHSLGEIISLCLAGVYTPELAWQIFDRRAVYIDGLERNAKDGMGMMAVYASYEKVQNILHAFPGLHICNHNTPTQFMLGGKKEELAEARRVLRKDKCPALTLPINMAFHHPHLRVLRQSAVEGLMGLPTLTPSLPVLSNVTAGLYPTDKDGIVKYIADLDENTVRWVDCVRAMWDTFDIRHFVEFGSADNICGLVKEIEPRAVCIPVSLKNAEVKTMRSAVAHLYALGHIPEKGLHVVPREGLGQILHTHEAEHGAAPSSDTHASAKVLSMQNAAEEKAVHAEAQAMVIAPHVQDILPILAEASGHDIGILRPSMDLRHELALRSNRFPSIMHKVEQLFGIRLRLEDVLHVATIQDFADVVARLRAIEVSAYASHAEHTSLMEQSAQTEPCEDASWAPLVCLQGAFSHERNALVWESIAWPSQENSSVLGRGYEDTLKGTAPKNLLILYTGEEQSLYHALDELAPLGWHFIFYAPAMACVQQPSAQALLTWQELGASHEIICSAQALQGRHMQSIVHFVEASIFHKTSSHVALPVLQTLEEKKLGISSVLTVVSDADRGQEAAFVTEPAITAMSDFWQKWKNHGQAGAQDSSGQKAALSSSIVQGRVLRIPPVLTDAMRACQKQEQNQEQDFITAYELAVSFVRWYACAHVEQGRWMRQSSALAASQQCSPCATLQEHVELFAHMHPLAYELSETEGGAREFFTAQRNFSVYAEDALKEQQGAGVRVPKVSADLLLQSLYHGAHMPFSWLRCHGGDAIVLQPETASAVTTGPEGVTQEALVQVISAAHETQENHRVKPCQVEISLRALSANGRRLDQWDRAAEAHMGLVFANYAPTSLWTEADESTWQKQHVQVRKKFAKQDALSYAWVSDLLTLLQDAALSAQGKEKTLSIKSIARLRHINTCFIKDVLQEDESLLTVQWGVLSCGTSDCTLSGQVLCAKGRVLLTVQDMFITKCE